MEYEQIWAPWRLGYILGEKDAPEDTPTPNLPPDAEPTCFLCQCGVASDDRQRAIVGRCEHSVTVLNRYPYNNGHLLVAREGTSDGWNNSARRSSLPWPKPSRGWSCSWRRFCSRTDSM